MKEMKEMKELVALAKETSAKWGGLELPSVYKHWREDLESGRMPNGGLVSPPHKYCNGGFFGLSDYSGYFVGTEPTFVNREECFAAAWILAVARFKVYNSNEEKPHGLYEAVMEKFFEFIKDDGFRRRFARMASLP